MRLSPFEKREIENYIKEMALVVLNKQNIDDTDIKATLSNIISTVES